MAKLKGLVRKVRRRTADGRFHIHHVNSCPGPVPLARARSTSHLGGQRVWTYWAVATLGTLHPAPQRRKASGRRVCQQGFWPRRGPENLGNRHRYEATGQFSGTGSWETMGDASHSGVRMYAYDALLCMTNCSPTK